MQTYFNIQYEFDQELVQKCIARQIRTNKADYICVADGVILNIANRKPEYFEIVNDGMFSICDSSYVPLYIEWIYGVKYSQYCGSQIFMDIIRSRKYRMIFMGTSQNILDGLKKNMEKINPDVATMTFYELPFKEIDEFDYPAIAEIVNKDGAEIIWIALGAPKQEIFMNRLKPFLNKGVMIAVGAAFKFYSGMNTNRAPKWMIQNHLEFIYRIFCEPKKQLKRCGWIILTLPQLFYGEWKRKKKGKSVRPLYAGNQ